MKCNKIGQVLPTIEVNNKQFAKGIFGKQWRRVLACWFEQDPGALTDKNLRQLWTAAPMRQIREKLIQRKRNNYFVVSLFRTIN